MQFNRKLMMLGGGLLVTALTVTAFVARRAPASLPTARQVIAIQHIPAMTYISSEMVKEVDVTEVEDKFATQVGEVVGKYAQRDIPEGNAVEKAAVQDTTAIARTPAPTHFAVPPGLRAVDVMVDPTSAVAVQVGDRVDVLAAYRMDGHDVMCRTIAQNVEVLHFAGRYTFYYEPPADRKQQGQEAAPPEEKTILVLAVSPALSQEILAAQDRGALTVAVRRRGDHHYHRLAETWEHPRAPHRHYP